jgi:hypothetical protein
VVTFSVFEVSALLKVLQNIESSAQVSDQDWEISKLWNFIQSMTLEGRRDLEAGNPVLISLRSHLKDVGR